MLTGQTCRYRAKLTYINGGVEDRTILKTIVSTAVAALMVALATAPAMAAGPPPDSPNATGGSVSSVVDISRQYNAIGYSKRITYCGVGTANATCTLSQNASVTRDIQVSASFSRDGIAGALGISSSSSVGVSVSCTSPALQPGQIWSAYPYGTRLSYRVVTRTTGSVTYSGWLSAFDPTGGIHCRL